MEKLLPQNIEAEEGVLGSIIIDPEAVVQVADFLRPEDFYRDAHRAIFQAVLDLYAERGPADLITLCDELQRRGRLEEVGGSAYVSSLVNAVPTSANVEYYARIVERASIMRRLIHAAGQMAALAYNESDANIALDKAEQLVFSISQRYNRSDFDDLRTLLDDYYEKLDKLHEQRGSLVGLPTGFHDLDKMTGGLQKSDLIILAARPAVGKCLTAGTLIDDPETGERLTIEACVQRRLGTVYGVSAEGKVRSTSVSDWMDNGVQPCYRVRTATGRMVEVTETHPFLTVRGWRPLSDLSVGAAIAIPRAVPVFGQDESWPLDLVRLLAYYVAEGGLTDTCPEFTNTDPVIVSDFKEIIARQFPQCVVRQSGITYIVSLSSRAGLVPLNGVPMNPVARWLNELGLWKKLAKDKRFPSCVWKWSKRYLAEFLRALMSCDGSIYALSQRPDLPRIDFTVASPQLAADLHHALTRFGILAKHYKTKYGAYRVEVTSPDAVRLYQEQIGWIGEKIQRFAGLTRVIAARLSNRGHPPKETWELVRVAARQQGLSMMEIARRSGETTATGHRAGYNPHMNRMLPSYRLAGYTTVLADPQLQIIASPDIYWDTIASIEPIGEQHVYDLTVPDGANFVAQDVLVHNSALALSLAYNTALKKNRVAFFALEMSKEQLVQRLLAMDAGIDQQRLRTGMIEDDEWERISHAIGRLSQMELYIDDTAGISTMEMRSKARRLAAERGIDLVIVDYLQLMQGHAGGRNENRVQEISEISRSLKALARELDVPVLALSQLSRAVESRQSRVPQLSDLRESGCLTGETLIYLPDEGAYRRIDSLVGQSGFNVLALNTETWKLKPRPVLRAFSTGYKLVYRLKTQLGRSIRATGNHQFLTIEGWRRLDELAPEMRIALPRTLPGPQAATMRREELALLGHLIGDGCTLPKHAVQYTSSDRDLAELVADLAVKVFGDKVVPRVNAERNWYQVYLPPSYRLTHRVRNPILSWLEAMGLDGLRSYEKFVPACVFSQSKEEIACFLRHLWATDGAAWSHASHAPAIYYATSSPRLAADVQSLLLRLDINARVLCVPQPGKGRDQYHVDISGKPDQERFINQVGLVGERKQKMLEGVREYLAARTANTNRDVIPRYVWREVVLPARKAVGLTERQMQASIGMSYCGTTLYKSNLSRERAVRVAEVVRSEELVRLASSDVYWDEIVSIELDGEEEVYDLTVEGLHNFVGNNIIAHNSIEQDSDIVLFIYRDEVYNPESDKKNIADIIVAKHRNGPIGQFSLYFKSSQTLFRNLDLHGPPS